jgi:putative transcriptional regulator
MTMTSQHINDRISELLLGDVSDGEREQLEAHVAGCADCSRELMQAADAFAALALALPAEAPPSELRARVLADATAPRLMAMLDKVAALFDVTRQKARAILDRIDNAAEWQDGPVPDAQVMFVDGGPKVAGAFTGIVKMKAGMDWPVHRHLGHEEMLVLDGGFKQDDGAEVHAGMTHVMEEGSVHGFRIFDDEPCISAVVLWGGVSFEKQ